MLRPKHNVLLIVEGAKDEPRLVDSLFKAFAHDEEWLIHVYGSVIHDLVAKINSDYDGDYDNIEIRKVLVEMLPDKQQAIRDGLLYTKFTDVILRTETARLARAALGVVAATRQLCGTQKWKSCRRLRTDVSSTAYTFFLRAAE